jgi:tetratricopeptide (TPR) repeat protein
MVIRCLPSLAAVVLFSPLLLLQGCSKEGKAERSLKSASSFLKAGDYDSAEIELKNALKYDAANSVALAELGGLWADQGISLDGARLLHAAKNGDPENDEIRLKLAAALLEMGFVPDCRKELLEVLDRSPENEEALILLAESSLSEEWMTETAGRLALADGSTSSVQLATALISLRRGSVDDGTKIVNEVLAADPGNIRAHALKAAILESSNQIDEALIESKKASDLAGLRSKETLAYARMLLANGQADEASSMLTKLTTDYPGYLHGWRGLGRIAMSRNEDELAAEHFSKVLSRNPTDLVTGLMQAEVFLRGGDAPNAISVLEKALSGSMSRPPVDLALAKSYLAADETAKALAAFNRVLESVPVHEEATRLRAQIHLQMGEAGKAIIELERARAQRPNDQEIVNLLVIAYRTDGRLDEAISIIREKPEDEMNARNMVELAQLLAITGKKDESLRLLTKARKAHSKDLMVVSALAALKEVMGESEDALKMVDEFIVVEPENAEALVVKASIEVGLERNDVAQETLEKALELDSGNAQAYALLLDILGAPGREKDALEVLERYLVKFPNDRDARLQIGNLQQALGLNEQAKATFEQIVKESPDFAAAYNNLAALESGPLDDLDRASTSARKARAFDPNHPAIADTLGWIEWRRGNFQTALALLIEAAAGLPDNAEVQYHLGMGYYSMGFVEESLRALEKSLEGETDFYGRQKAIESLEQLRSIGKFTLEELKLRADQSPDDVVARMFLAQALVREERFEEAVEAYQMALKVNASLAPALIGQSRIYGGSLNDPVKALETAREARKISPRDPSVLAALGRATFVSGSHDEAYGLLKDAYTILGTADTGLMFDLALATYSLGRVGEARDLMNKVSGGDEELTSQAEDFLYFTNPDALDSPQIATEISRKLAVDPSYAPALVLNGDLERSRGESPESSYLKALEAYPHLDLARIRLAEFYLEDPSRLDEADALIQQAKVNLPEDSDLLSVLGGISYRKGDYPYAIQVLNLLGTKRDLSAQDHYILGMSLASEKQIGAKSALERAVEMGLPEPELTKAKDTLAQERDATPTPQE